MARIRTIKPELWASEQIADCSRDARLLFIGLLNFCDDNGIHQNAPRRLKAEVFPHDNDVTAHHVANWLDELTGAGLICSYATSNAQFIVITGWDRHQKIERPTYRHPLPDGNIGKLSPTDRRNIRELSSNIRRISSNTSPHPRPRNGMESNGVPLPSQDEIGCSPLGTQPGESAQKTGNGDDDEF